MHLRVNTENIWVTNDKSKISKIEGRKPNSVSQLRIGFERLFDNSDNKIKEILENVSLTYFPLIKYEDSINRFYAEDIAIGNFFPLFNIDVER